MLRFGVQPLQFIDVLEDVAGAGPSAVGKFDYLKFCRAAVEAGFSHVELLADMHYVIPGSLREGALRELRELGEGGVSFSVHLPVWSIELASPNPHVREASITSTVESIELLEPLEPLCYVIHLTGSLAAEFSRLSLPGEYRELVIEQLARISADSVRRILRETGVDPRLLAAENVEFPFKHTWRVIEEFDLSFCLDTGHLLAGYSGNLELLELAKSCWSRIVEVHLHDGYERRVGSVVARRDHLPLGSGDMPVAEFYELLVERGFSGPLVFELPLRDAIKSLEVLRGSTQSV